MTAGRGYIALSTIILGRHRPVNIALAGILFGLCDALQIRLQQSPFPTQFIQMIPYVVTVIVITFFIGKDDSPSAIGIPY
jgi:simple sugar transport system permease protein